MARSDQTAKLTPPPDLDTVDFSWLTGWARRRAERSRLWARLRPPSAAEGWGAAVGGLVVALVLGLWLTAGAWGPRPPSGEDTLPHLIRTQFALRELLPHGRIDGWHPTFILGYQEFLFIGPGFTWAVGLVRVLSLGLLSTPGAFKVVFIGSFVVLPLAVAFFARSFGLSRRGSALAGILTLAVNNPFGVGLQGLFNVGLVVHQFGAIFFFLTLGGVLRLIEKPSPRWTIFSGIAGAALLASHGISVILLAPLLAIVLLVHLVPTTSEELRKKRFELAVRQAVRAELRRLGTESSAPPDEEQVPAPVRPSVPYARLVKAGLLAAALAACILLPFLAHRDLRGGFTGWGTPSLGDRLHQIWTGQTMFRPGVAPIVLAGLLFGVYRAYQGRKYALAMVAAPIAHLLISHAALHLWSWNVVTVQLPNRGVGYIGVLAMLPLAALVDRVTGTRQVGHLFAVALAAAIVVLPLGDLRPLARQSGEPVLQMELAARQLASLVPDHARFITERDFPGEVERTGLVNPDRWLAWASGRNTLNNFNVESSTAGAPAFEAEHIRDRPADAVGDSLSRLGVTHLVTVSEEGYRHVSTSSGFRQVWAAAPVSIFAVLPRPAQPEPGALLTADVPVEARVTSGEAEALDLSFRASSAGRANVAIAWSPKWHASLDGRSVPLRRGTDGLMELSMPAGDHRLELRFRPDVWDRLGLAISVTTVLLVVLWSVGRHRSRAAKTES